MKEVLDFWVRSSDGGMVFITWVVILTLAVSAVGALYMLQLLLWENTNEEQYLKYIRPWIIQARRLAFAVIFMAFLFRFLLQGFF